MPEVTISQGDTSQVVRELALENAPLREQRAAFVRTISQMDTELTTLKETADVPKDEGVLFGKVVTGSDPSEGPENPE